MMPWTGSLSTPAPSRCVSGGMVDTVPLSQLAETDPTNIDQNMLRQVQQLAASWK